MQRQGGAIAVLGLSLLLAALFLAQPAGLVRWQEAVFDRLIRALPRASVADPVVVVDIGALDEAGRPWDRVATARLMVRIAQAQPKVVGVDMVFSGACDDPANAALAHAFAQAPTVLGFLLTDAPTPPLPGSNLAVAEGAALWRAAGAEGPCAAFAAVAAGVASVALPGDADARVRRLPVGVVVAGVAYPSLPVEVARRAAGFGPALAGPDWLRLGPQMFPAEAGSLRFVPTGPEVWAARRVAAEDVLTGTGAHLSGAVVLIGSSLPQRGGLRPTAASPVAPSVQITADLIEGLQAGRVPQRPDFSPLLEAGFVLLAGLLGLGLVRRSTPGRGAATGMAAVVLWVAVSAIAYISGGWLLDPLGPALATAAVLLMALLGKAVTAARAERALRLRMGQVLPPALVSRIAAQPALMRLEGEAREVTALFTDIEGFSLATRALGPRDLVAALDAYFTLTCAIVLKHGGMVDKLVGDSIHALFNAPLDQPGHAEAALACAAELITATEAFRAGQGGFGRTRIGIETGQAVLGDVGFGGKIDYTAHGDAVNLAARLQDANKSFGTQICIGPGTAARVGNLRPLGETEIRSFGRLALFTLP